MKYSKAQQTAEHFSNFVNSSIHDKDEFANEVTSDHRFLQQEMFMSMLKCMDIWADDCDNDVYDARNEYTVKASKVMIEALKEKGMY